jgi:hypothetical protein
MQGQMSAVQRANQKLDLKVRLKEKNLEKFQNKIALVHEMSKTCLTNSGMLKSSSAHASELRPCPIKSGTMMTASGYLACKALAVAIQAEPD